MAVETNKRVRRPSRAQTRTALLAAAARVIARRGYAGASVEAITEAAGFSRGAFYSNFATKEELVLELLGQDGAAGAGLDERQRLQLWLEVVLHASRDEAFRRRLAEVAPPLHIPAVASASSALDLDLPLPHPAP
jgi:AcrR family transcriptional regulator